MKEILTCSFHAELCRRRLEHLLIFSTLVKSPYAEKRGG